MKFNLRICVSRLLDLMPHQKHDDLRLANNHVDRAACGCIAREKADTMDIDVSGGSQWFFEKGEYRPLCCSIGFFFGKAPIIVLTRFRRTTMGQWRSYFPSTSLRSAIMVVPDAARIFIVDANANWWPGITDCLTDWRQILLNLGGNRAAGRPWRLSSTSGWCPALLWAVARGYAVAPLLLGVNLFSLNWGGDCVAGRLWCRSSTSDWCPELLWAVARGYAVAPLLLGVN